MCLNYFILNENKHIKCFRLSVTCTAYKSNILSLRILKLYSQLLTHKIISTVPIFLKNNLKFEISIFFFQCLQLFSNEIIPYFNLLI